MRHVYDNRTREIKRGWRRVNRERLRISGDGAWISRRGGLETMRASRPCGRTRTGRNNTGRRSATIRPVRCGISRGDLFQRAQASRPMTTSGIASSTASGQASAVKSATAAMKVAITSSTSAGLNGPPAASAGAACPGRGEGRRRIAAMTGGLPQRLMTTAFDRDLTVPPSLHHGANLPYPTPRPSGCRSCASGRCRSQCPRTRSQRTRHRRSETTAATPARAGCA